MSTFMQNPEKVERAWYLLDAAGLPLGRVAAEAAGIIRGKHKTEYTPHVDTGDFIVIVNAAQVVLTGRKAEQKLYRRHSGYAGGLKETKYRDIMQKRPEFAVRLAVRGMLPKNSLSRRCLLRMKVYAGAEHPHAAQKPQARKIGGVA
jgi:large subunit ribosomal protein L13